MPLLNEVLSLPIKLPNLSNRDLVVELKSWSARDRQVTVGVLLVLNEFEKRRLHLDQYSSLFKYCTDLLGFSNAAAWRRITAARCLRDYPTILPMLLDGRLNITTLCILARVLDEQNATGLLARASGASQEQVERLAAEFGAPKPARDRIKPVKSLRAPGSVGDDASGDHHQPDSSDARSSGDAEGSSREPEASKTQPTLGHERSAENAQAERIENSTSEGRDAANTTTHAEPVGPNAGTATTASDEAASDQATADCGATDHEPADKKTEKKVTRDSVAGAGPMYDVTFRADREVVEKLRRAQAVLSSGHQNPSIALVVDRALEMLLDRHDPARREDRRQAREDERLRRQNATQNTKPVADQPRREPQRSNEARARSGRSADSALETDQPRGEPQQSNEPRVHAGRPVGRARTARTDHASEDGQLQAVRRPVPQRIRDQVFLLYGMQCAHVGPEGRCPETHNLDLDHIQPWAAGGSDDPTNLRPMCHAHNQRAADHVFGSEFMNSRRYGTSPPEVDRESTREPMDGLLF